MKVYAIATTTPVPLSELRLYTSKVKAEQNKNEGDSIVELDVDEYPAFEELNAWLQTLTTPENLLGVMKALQRAEKYGLGWEVLFSAYERQDEPDFEIVDALHEACYRWDV